MYKKYNKAGNLHSEEGPAVQSDNGDQYWYHDGRLQNIEGPAFIGINGTRCWYFDANLHRFNGGPAVETAEAENHWYIFGTRVSEEEYKNSKFLPKDEIFSALDSPTRDKLIIGALVNKTKNTITFWRGNFGNVLIKSFNIPFSAFESSNNTPNFDDLSIIDCGQTIKLGDYEACAEAIIEDANEK